MRTQVIEISKTKTKATTTVAVAFVCVALALMLLPALKMKSVPSSGCFIKVDGKNIFIANTDKNQCRDLALLEYASEDSSKEDLVFTIKSFDQSFQLSKEDLDSDKIKIVYKSGQGEGTDFNAYLEDIKTAKQCKSFEYFGITLNCFNEVRNVQGAVIKPNNLKKIIKYMAFLKYASRDVVIPLFPNQTISPFNYVIGKKIIFYDASVSSLVGENGKCDSGTSAAHTGGTAKSESGQHKVFICSKSLDSSNKIKLAGIIFHEALHFNELDIGHVYYKNNGQCLFNKGKPGINNADYDLASVYGGEISFLYDMSINSDLSCSIRKAAYNEAMQKVDHHICLKITTGFVAPICD